MCGCYDASWLILSATYNPVVIHGSTPTFTFQKNKQKLNLTISKVVQFATLLKENLSTAQWMRSFQALAPEAYHKIWHLRNRHHKKLLTQHHRGDRVEWVREKIFNFNFILLVTIPLQVSLILCFVWIAATTTPVTSYVSCNLMHIIIEHLI